MEAPAGFKGFHLQIYYSGYKPPTPDISPCNV